MTVFRSKPTIDPNWLHDHVDPEKDNDPREVIKLADTADLLDGRRPPARSVNTLDEPATLGSTERFQRARGMKPDRAANAKGATVKRMNKEVYEQAVSAWPGSLFAASATSAAPAATLGSALAARQAAGAAMQRAAKKTAAQSELPPLAKERGPGRILPLAGSVGAGGDNYADDLTAMDAALTLAEGRTMDTDDRKAARRHVDPEDEAARAADITRRIDRVQGQQGLKRDGFMETFGPTHRMIEGLLAPQLEALIGRDPGNPDEFVEQEPQIVARVKKFRPTTVSTSFQDEESLRTRPEYDAARILGTRIHSNDHFVDAWADEADDAEDAATDTRPEPAADTPEATPDPLPLADADTDKAEDEDIPGGGEGNDSLAGDEGHDDLTAGGDAVSAARARIAGLAPELSPEQLAEAARQAVASGTADADDAALARHARRVADDYGAFAEGLRQDLESGRIDVEGLEARLAGLTRDRVTAGTSETRRRRIAATMSVLAERYLDQAEDRGLTLDRAAVEAQVQAIIDAATADEPIDIELLGDILWTAIDFVPIVGEAKSAYEAIDLYQQILDAQAAEPPRDTTELYAAFSLAMLGAVPFLGKGVKALKLGQRVKGAVEKVKSWPKEQAARRKLREYEEQFGKKLPKRPLKDLIDPEVWDGLSEPIRKTAESIYVKRKGEAGEVYVKALLDEGNLRAPLKGEAFHRRFFVKAADRSEVVWLLDEAVEGRIDDIFGGFVMIKKGGNGTGYEIKLDAGNLTDNQKKAEHARAVLNRELSPDPSVELQKSGMKLPLIGTNVRKLRIPMEEVPFDTMWETLEKGFRDYNAKRPKHRQVPPELVDGLKANLRNTYDVYEEALAAANAAQRAELRRQFTAGAVFVAAATAILAFEEKKGARPEHAP